MEPQADSYETPGIDIAIVGMAGRFPGAKTYKDFRKMLEEMGHPQAPMPVQMDNSTA